MKIDKRVIENNLTIKLEGRLDTNTVAELEKEMSDLNGIQSIVFDFENLEYISSFGLRLVLKCKKEIVDIELHVLYLCVQMHSILPSWNYLAPFHLYAHSVYSVNIRSTELDDIY